MLYFLNTCVERQMFTVDISGNMSLSSADATLSKVSCPSKMIVDSTQVHFYYKWRGYNIAKNEIKLIKQVELDDFKLLQI